MWIKTLDEQLINLSQVETLELVSSVSGTRLVPGFETSELEPDYFEILANLPSGRQHPLFANESAALVRKVFDAIAIFTEAHTILEDLANERVISAEDALT
jgi:hypothetical protein